MCRELKKWGNEPEFRELQGVGHNIPREASMARNAWLIKQVRRQPASFKFVVLPGEDRYTTIWGIRLHVEDPLKPGELECQISAQGEVTLHTTNVKGLDINFDATGLSVPVKEVEVKWNDKVVFSGKPKPLSLTQ